MWDVLEAIGVLVVFFGCLALLALGAAIAWVLVVGDDGWPVE